MSRRMMRRDVSSGITSKPRTATADPEPILHIKFKPRKSVDVVVGQDTSVVFPYSGDFGDVTPRLFVGKLIDNVYDPSPSAAKPVEATVTDKYIIASPSELGLRKGNRYKVFCKYGATVSAVGYINAI